MQKIPFETLQGLTFGTSYTKIADSLLYFSRFSENERNNVQPNEYYETKTLICIRMMRALRSMRTL